jgi:acetyl esterase/lipase
VPAAPSLVPTESAVAASQATAVPPTTVSNPTPSTFKDLEYATVSAAEKLDLYLPAGNGPFPLIVYVHGGGWRMNDKSLAAQKGIAARLVKEGYAVASLNYRLSGEAKFPAQVQDVKTAVRWLRAHAQEYNLDSTRFAAWGDSAGANLASMLGTSCGVSDLEGADLGNADQSSCVQALVDFYGPMDFLQIDQEFSGTACAANHNKASSAESQYVGGPIQQYKTVVEKANPITYITADDPPAFIEYGTADCTVPPQQNQLFYDALKPVIGADKVTITSLPGAEHGDRMFFTQSNFDLVVAFLNKYLK